VNVTLNNVNNAAVNVTIPISILAADVNGDRTVNSGDAIITRNRSGQSADATDFRADVNLDGVINSGDTTIVRAQSGTGL
jgi:hypothetical protein